MVSHHGRAVRLRGGVTALASTEMGTRSLRLVLLTIESAGEVCSLRTSSRDGDGRLY